MKDLILKLFDDGHPLVEISMLTYTPREKVVAILRNNQRLTPVVCYKCKELVRGHKKCPDCKILQHEDRRCECTFSAEEVSTLMQISDSASFGNLSTDFT
jgi:hypothetical protein